MQTEYKLTKSIIDGWYSWDPEDVDRIDELIEDINAGEWYDILKAHIKPGNSKVSKNTWVFNICSAHECPHLETDRCQVTTSDSTKCYAFKDERQYPAPLPYRRRQSVIWDVLDAETFASTLIEIWFGKTGETITNFRVNESGDLRHEGDLHKLNQIARILEDTLNITTYIYSASSDLDWNVLDERYFTVNGSNPMMEPYADRLFMAKSPEDIDEDEIVCPAEQYGRDEIQCGECRLCIDDSAGDVIVPLH